MNSPSAYLCCQAERAFLKAVGGGCQVPYGAYAYLEGESLILSAIYAEDEIGDSIKRKKALKVDNLDEEATHLANDMIKEFKKLRG